MLMLKRPLSHYWTSPLNNIVSYLLSGTLLLAPCPSLSPHLGKTAPDGRCWWSQRFSDPGWTQTHAWSIRATIYWQKLMKTVIEIMLVMSCELLMILRHWLNSNSHLSSHLLTKVYVNINRDIISWEPEGHYHYSKMFCWDPEGRYRHRHCTAIAPFWFSMEHCWILILRHWLNLNSRLKHSSSHLLTKVDVNMNWDNV